MSRMSVRWARIPAVLAVVLSITLGAFATPVSVGAQTGDDALTGVSGDSYVSPSFGYSLEWDRTWEVTNEVVEEDFNQLQIEDLGSLMWITGYAPATDVEECIETEISSLETQDGFSDVDATDPVETEDGGAEADVSFVLTFEDEETGEDVSSDWLGYVKCLEINDGEANLLISHYGLADGWDAEIEAREEVLATLAIDGEAAPEPEEDESEDEPAPTDEEDEEPADDETPAPDQSSEDGVSAAVVTEVQGDGELPPNADDLLELFETSINDIHAFWSREYPLISGGQTYDPPEAFVPYVGTIDTGCGTATSWDPEAGFGDGPFFCPLDQTIYLDVPFANFQFEQVGNIPFLIPVVLAHEVGHHVQDILGMEVCYETPCLDPNVLTSQEIEYMADCYAGAWSRDAELRGRLGERDIDANIVQYAVILGGGQESAEPGGHGRGSERVWWFLNGYLEGSAKCFESSPVTAEWAQTGPPNAQTDETPEPDDEPTQTPVEEPTGDVVAMGVALETDEGTLTVTETQVETAIENREADGQFLIVFLEVLRPEGDSLPFTYDGWTVTDEEGNVYELDGRTTDVLLSSAYDDGADEVLEAGAGYNIAFVFDIPEDASGLVLTNEVLGIAVQLDQ